MSNAWQALSNYVINYYNYRWYTKGMDIDLQKLNHSFSNKPLLVGGKAMEYYGLRKAGADIDFVAAEEDVVVLIKQYPDRVKDLWGDLGVCPFDFEIWRTICSFDYDYFKEGAEDKGEYLIVSLEKLLFMRALAMKKEKYMKDLELIVDEILKEKSEEYESQKQHNEKLLEGIENITYIEKTGSIE